MCLAESSHWAMCVLCLWNDLFHVTKCQDRGADHHSSWTDYSRHWHQWADRQPEEVTGASSSGPAGWIWHLSAGHPSMCFYINAVLFKCTHRIHGLSSFYSLSLLLSLCSCILITVFSIKEWRQMAPYSSACRLSRNRVTVYNDLILLLVKSQLVNMPFRQMKIFG